MRGRGGYSCIERAMIARSDTGLGRVTHDTGHGAGSRLMAIDPTMRAARAMHRGHARFLTKLINTALRRDFKASRAHK